MENQFCIIFDTNGTHIETRNFTPLVTTPEQEGVSPSDVFYHTLSLPDIHRFAEFCRRRKRPVKYGNKSDRMAIFYPTDFYGYSYAFAEKNLSVEDDRIYVRFFSDPQMLFRHTLRICPLFSAQHKYLSSETAKNKSQPNASPVEKTIHQRRVPITNLLRIAELSVRQLSSDPCFFGNRFILSGDGCLFASKRPQNPKHMLRFIYLFSDAALITVIYIAFTALANITSTHDLWLSVHTDSDGAEIRLETNIPPIPTSKKEAAKTFSRCTETLISFALCLAETEGFAPSSAHDPEKNTYSIHLHIGKENKSEGEFRCGEPTGEEISELFQNAGLLAGLLNEKNSE